MTYSNSKAIIFYSIAILVSLVLSALIMTELNWPASAKIPICLTILIQLNAVAKYVLNVLEEINTDSILDAIAMLKAGFSESESGS
ncbi:hypothetical protein G3570_08295 [Balneolaceae bacterium YR4-1]|uniref:Uncharacterized protein n=1 Tax=Halalkalibaculum roseum TaxID=2709311 RepID=A0A6M1SUN2_9BACT|nr:hypothetical protein [Halalkalibaculum roseum]NGP76630.1 hypothetical protein [Halalkalibaculum roseum]